MAMSYEEWSAANPAPYDLQKFVQDSNAQYAGMQYVDRPQSFHDEYAKMLDANKRWQASYYTQSGAAPSNEAAITNTYVPVWNGAARKYMSREESDVYGQGPNADPTIVPGGTPAGTQLQKNPVTGNYGGVNPVSAMLQARQAQNAARRAAQVRQVQQMLAQAKLNSRPQSGMLTGQPMPARPAVMPPVGAPTQFPGAMQTYKPNYGPYTGPLWGTPPAAAPTNPMNNPGTQALLRSIFGGQ